MTIYSYASFGYEGELVTVEVDLRPALPGIEIVGLPDSAIREAKERIRVAIRNSGFEYPTKRILVNLYPAGVPKAGASFDLPIALGILAACGIPGNPPERILALGELQLSGRIRAVDGVIAALHESEALGELPRLVPEENRAEAAAAGIGNLCPVGDLADAVDLLRAPASWKPRDTEDKVGGQRNSGDRARLRRYGGMSGASQGPAGRCCGGPPCNAFRPPGFGKIHGGATLSFDPAAPCASGVPRGNPHLFGGGQAAPPLGAHKKSALPQAPPQCQPGGAYRRRTGSAARGGFPGP